jgi:hypothetical protein
LTSGFFIVTWRKPSSSSSSSSANTTVFFIVAFGSGLNSLSWFFLPLISGNGLLGGNFYWTYGNYFDFGLKSSSESSDSALLKRPPFFGGSF